ncbi:helix-turn-helix domain-containing protein [Flammeovirga agarivorans]|uniref:Helix-turn-helix transcriptional regulator n=1 Tax=Flammeovirga agarivorans TaxID=2726742 RepID=A0A7X8SJR5_9BACT|nr:AraC family transcriptional regulator [Flammeovirga agarivorans]NLR91514.1 helix-turn-helix transcriptional regulator [Flammeovirga agarivorans]
MEEVHFNDRGDSTYYEYLKENLKGKPVDKYTLSLKSDLIDGTLFVVEEKGFRITSIDYKVLKDFSINFTSDKQFDYTIIFFCEDVTYSGHDDKPIHFSVPTGFLILDNTQNIIFERKKGTHQQRVTLYFNRSDVSPFLNEKLNTIKDFAFHKGDDHTAIWKKVYFDKGPKDINPKLRNRWHIIKLHELCLIISNILLSFNGEEDLKKIYMDHEFEAVFEIRDYIQHNFHEKPIMSKLTKKYGINSTKLNEIFKYCFGQTVYKYYKHARIYKVRDEIITTHKSLTEIAYEFGFSDINHLSKSFIEEFGEKPSELKNSSKNDSQKGLDK